MQICNRELGVSNLGRCIITILPYTYFPYHGLLMMTFGAFLYALLTALWPPKPVTLFSYDGAVCYNFIGTGDC